MAEPIGRNEPNDGDDTERNQPIQIVISDGDENNTGPTVNSDFHSSNIQLVENVERHSHAPEPPASLPQPLYAANYYVPGHPSSLAPHPSYLYPPPPHPSSFNPYESHHSHFHPPFFPPVSPFAMHPLPPSHHIHAPTSLLPTFAIGGTTQSYSNGVATNNNPASIAEVYHQQAARMRDHAAAYANMAANAAFIASQIANAAAEFTDEIKRSNMQSLESHHCGQQQPIIPGATLQVGSSCQQYLPVYSQETERSPNDSLTCTQVEQSHVASAEACTRQSADDDQFAYPRNRRKRYQRVLPSELLLTRDIPKTGSQQHQQREKGRRRLRSDGDSSTTSSGSSFMLQGNCSLASQKRRSGNHHNKKKARSDESLIGKTAVAALFEWCSKRRITPNFILEQKSPEEFDFLVCLDDDEHEDESNFGSSRDRIGNRELGRGRGRNKVAAKQEAARKTLQILIPGVVFDEDTGLLLELPSSSGSGAMAQRRKNLISSSLDDLAPNLAKQLAIGRESVTDQLSIQNQQAKRSFDVYPGTSTTSEDEDNAYYTSRGASVCSVLLHAMIQIDSNRLPEAPSFSYQVSPTPPLLSATNIDDRRRKFSAGRALRGSFICTAKLKIRSQPSSDNERESDQVEFESETFLEATGVGGTKRESRHTASAKLLAMLFPDCKDMKEVKAAAESMREKYAASKSLKSQTMQTNVRKNANVVDGKDNPFISIYGQVLAVGMSKRSDPPLPRTVENGFRVLLGDVAVACNDDVTSPTGTPTSQLGTNHSSALAFRNLTRQKQIDFRVETALQICNDRDEEGRVLPEELTDDDVGRLVLRRAEPEDLPRIKKFRFVSGVNQRSATYPFDSANLETKKTSPSKLMKTSSCLTKDESFVSLLWSPSTVVLLLCRAIAAFEDPLGCAVLTLGFSIEEGCILRLAQIASERHLPIERFLDCLQNFASCMKCELDTTTLSEGPDNIVLASADCQAIIESHIPFEVGLMTKRPSDQYSMSASDVVGEKSFREKPSKLQSVQEESEVSDSSGNDKRLAKRNDKPSKRSRFQ